MKVKIEDHSQEVIRNTDLAILEALEIIGGKLERYAKQKLTSTGAVDTGLLRNSVTYAVSGGGTSIQSYHADKDSSGVSARSKKAGTIKVGRYTGTVGSQNEKAVYVGTNVEYAPYIEFGTSRMNPRPYLKPAVQDHLQEYRNIITKTLKKVGK